VKSEKRNVKCEKRKVFGSFVSKAEEKINREASQCPGVAQDTRRNDKVGWARFRYWLTRFASLLWQRADMLCAVSNE
jgi:hypothetical protein